MENLPVYSYEELTILWETRLVERHFIIDQMGLLLLQGGEDAAKAESFLREVLKRGAAEEKKHALEALRSAAKVDNGNHRNHR
jgi:hypothetical protein